MIARVPVVAIEPLAIAATWLRSRVDSRYRWHGIMRCEIGRHLLAQSKGTRGSRRVVTCRAREHLIDQCVYFGRRLRGAHAWPQLQAIAGQLAAEVTRLRACDPSRPVIVSPFHYVSQYANIQVVDALRASLGLGSLAVVSGVPRDLYGDDHALIPGMELLYTYGDENRNGLGLRVARALKRDGVAVLFADVPPFALHRYPMETVGVSMFGRCARIHNGVFRLGARLDAWLLPFYLRFERGRFGVELFEPLPLADACAPQRLARYIETALTDNFSDSIIAIHPSMYAFAAAR